MEEWVAQQPLWASCVVVAVMPSAQTAGGEASHVRLAREFLSGLVFLHSLGIAHTDLQPANLVLSAKSGTLKIAGMGLARKTSASNDALLFGDANGRCNGIFLSPEILLPSDGKKPMPFFLLLLLLFLLLSTLLAVPFVCARV